MASENISTIPGELRAIADRLERALTTPPPLEPTTPAIASAAALDRAIAEAAPDATLVLATRLVYSAPLVLTAPITLVSETYALSQGQRMTLDEPAPLFTAGIEARAPNVRLLGPDVKPQTIESAGIALRGDNPIVDRARILGDPVSGARRGIYCMGMAHRIARCYIDEIRWPDRDTQAIYAQDMGPGLDIDDCYLSAAGQAVMIGGGDPVSESRIPRNISITRSTLTKKRAWYERKTQIKCALELKNCIGFKMSDCLLEYAGTSEGQAAYVIVLTVRNQDGRAPWSTIQDVLIEHVRGRYGSGGINVLAYDTIRETSPNKPTPVGERRPSIPMRNVAIREAWLEEIDPLGFTKMNAAKGSGRIIYVDRGPADLTVDGLTVTGANLEANAYFDHEAPTGMVLRNWKIPPTKYGWKTPLGTTLPKLKEYAPDAVIDVTPTDAGATQVPA